MNDIDKDAAWLHTKGTLKMQAFPLGSVKVGDHVINHETHRYGVVRMVVDKDFSYATIELEEEE